MPSSKELDDLAVENFRTYLRFPTVHPNPDYTDAVDWLRKQGVEMGLECFVTEVVANNPIVIMRWCGSEPSLRSIMLNSHMDVVPVEREKWSHDPFAAEMDSDGNIYGRGAQDMKSVGMQQLEAVRRLKAEGYVPRRTIYLTFVPDEEVGGGRGMQPFVAGVKPDRGGAGSGGGAEMSFAEMNVGLCLDEGIACPREDVFYAFYEERSPWWVSFVIPGKAGHGSRFIEDTAVEKLHRLMGRLLAFREAEKKKLEQMNGNDLALGSVVTLNINVVKGGVEPNIVPSKIELQVDFCLPPTLDFAAFERQIHQWADESGKGIKVTFLFKDMGTEGGGCMDIPIDAHPNDVWWRTLEAVLSARCIGLQTGISGGANDDRYLRQYHRLYAPNSKPIKAISFSPLRNTPILHHASDEFVNRKAFLEGVEIVTEVVRAVASVEREEDDA